MPYKVRFHLAQGQNYRKWQVKCGSNITYHDPEKVILIMRNCKLKNHKTVAKQIFNGSHKTVCAWIECDHLAIVPILPIVGNPAEISYNPKKAPHWVCNNIDVDNKTFHLLHTNNRKVLCPMMKSIAS